MRPLRARRRSVVTACVAAGLAACNALSGLDEDYVLAPPDGGQSPSESDAGMAPDRAIQDGALPDAPTGPVDGGQPDGFDCDGSNVVFCTDFEGDAAWNETELLSGTVTFDQGAGIASSRAMHAHVDDVTVSRRAALWKRISGADAETYAHYDIAFELRVSEKTIDYAALGVLALTQQGGGLPYYGLAAYSEGALQLFEVVDDNPRIAGDGVGVEAALGGWHHARITYDRGAAGYDVEIFVDGKSVDKRSGFEFGEPQTAELRLGIFFTTADTGSMDLFLDNVVVRRH